MDPKIAILTEKILSRQRPYPYKATRPTCLVEEGQPFPDGLADEVVAAVRHRGSEGPPECVRRLAAAFGNEPRGRLVIVDHGQAPWKKSAEELARVRGYAVSILEEGDAGGLSVFGI